MNALEILRCRNKSNQPVSFTGGVLGVFEYRIQRKQANNKFSIKMPGGSFFHPEWSDLKATSESDFTSRSFVRFIDPPGNKYFCNLASQFSTNFAAETPCDWQFTEVHRPKIDPQHMAD